MDFGLEQRNPSKHAYGIGLVVLLHVLLGWAAVSGMGQRLIEVIKAPIETKIIEEVKPPPAPPVFNAPPAPPAPPAPVAPPAPPRVAARPAIANVQACAPTGEDYPAAALRAEATGTTKIRFTVGPDGRMTGAEVVRSSGPSREHKQMDRVALAKLSGCSFKAGADENGKPVGASFDVDYVWKLE